MTVDTLTDSSNGRRLTVTVCDSSLGALTANSRHVPAYRPVTLSLASRGPFAMLWHVKERKSIALRRCIPQCGSWPSDALEAGVA